MTFLTSDIKYEHLPWGEVISGTKEELQRLGIAAGRAFPGEVSAPRRCVNTLDPRGFPARITKSYLGDGYSAHIDLPGRERQEVAPEKAFAPGVVMQERYRSDDYTGTADALVTAGLMEADQFPGQPGMRKVVVTIFADGTLPSGAPTANHRCARAPGAMRVRRASKTTFCVSVFVPDNVAESRRIAYRAAEAEYETRMRALPRPPPLRPGAAAPSHPASTASNVIDLRAARTAKSAVSTEKDGERFLFDVTRAESFFLSYLYENGHEKSATRLLKIAESGPDRDLNRGYLSRVYITDGEVEFLRFMAQKGPVAAARALMKSVSKPLPGEEGSWGKVVSITPAPRLASPTAPLSLAP